MSTTDFFKKLNIQLANNIIPVGNETIECGSSTNPLNPIFQMSFLELISTQNKVEKTPFLLKKI